MKATAVIHLPGFTTGLYFLSTDPVGGFSSVLRESADLYSEVYPEDSELKHITDSAISEWPE
jgi:hypothetical protein